MISLHGISDWYIVFDAIFPLISLALVISDNNHEDGEMNEMTEAPHNFESLRVSGEETFWRPEWG